MKLLIAPTKSIADKEIIIESGPQPETPEKKIERLAGLQELNVMQIYDI